MVSDRSRDGAGGHDDRYPSVNSYQDSQLEMAAPEVPSVSYNADPPCGRGQQKR